MPLAVIDDVPLSLKTPSGQIISLTPDEETEAFKNALKISVERCAVDCMTDHIERRKALYNALGLAAGLTLGGLILALLGGGKR